MVLRVVGVLTVATLACAAAHTVRAEPRPADACKRTAFRAVIDVGHTAQAPGATSARGFLEFSFNLILAKRIEQQLLAAGFRRSCSWSPKVLHGRHWRSASSAQCSRS